MLPEEVRQLKSSHEILFKESERPVLARKIRYYSDPVFKHRILPQAPVPLLKVEPIAPRHFEIPDASSNVRETENDIPLIHPQDDADVADLTAMAAELEQLLSNEAQANQNKQAASAAAALKTAIDPGGD